MVDIAPFRAIRYAVAAVGDVARVIAPPYDVISADLQDALYERHPNNIVRIDLNKAEAGDAELARYDRSAAMFSDWLARGVMVQDGKPAFYVLSQTFHGPDGVERVRTGFFGCARLTRFGEGPIMPHERTLEGPKIDRLRLFRATKANLSPIFGMYRDPDGSVLAILKAAQRREPAVVAEMDGVVNRMWILEDGAASIVEAFDPLKIYIADGHHRYETGLAYRDERRAAVRVPQAGTPGYESILMFVAAVEDPGMVVFPTHRLVHGVNAIDERLARVDRFFDRSEAPSSPDALVASLRAAGRRGNAFAAVTKASSQIWTLRKDAPLEEIADLPKHPDVRRLDVTILHGVILEHLLGITKQAQASQQNLRYSKDAKEAIGSPAGDVQIAFLMNPTKVQEVIDVSNAGEVMPQKSTFFYPKIPSGLVLYPLD
jgi:uncharacterized protein (DUF1015 family)